MGRRVAARIRWVLRRVLPLTLTHDQAALYDAVTVHGSLGSTDHAVLLPKIADQIGATRHDLRVVAHILGCDC
ncbi:hypothetical protein ACH4T9_12865 [Micromonospora sp. NPDC020750]|uniref:hypothetical protein n=1 Tax=unclassified Micromonospora TaxID=2617518 RepID=UPI00379F4A2A